MKFTDIMIDIETLSSAPNAAVIQIGACGFNIETGEVDDQPFNVAVRPDKRADISVETVCWWMQQGDKARMSVVACEDGLREPEALASLGMYILDRAQDMFTVNVWAMPPEFDLSILRSLADRQDRKLPWHFADTRDLRTLERLAGGSKSNRIAPAIPHIAGEDAKAQALTAIKYFAMIGRRS